MAYPDTARERAMTVQEVLLKAVSGEPHWFQAADILGWSPRTLRRSRARCCPGRLRCTSGSRSTQPRPCLIAVSDDATKRVFHAAWWSMTARLAVVLRTGSRPRPAPGGSVAEACDTRRSADGLDNAPLDRGLTGSFDTLVALIGN